MKRRARLLPCLNQDCRLGHVFDVPHRLPAFWRFVCACGQINHLEITTAGWELWKEG